MGNTKQCNWITLLPITIIGAEEDGESGSTSEFEGKSEGDDVSKGKEGAGSASEGSSGEGHDDEDDPKVQGLKSALEKERKERKANDKELARLRSEKEEKDLADKSEVEQLRIKMEKSTERETRLAEGFLREKLNTAIKTAAKTFIDTDDALAGVDRSKLVYEQDPEDPSNVTIDLKSVESAVKALATAKPHFIKSGTDDGEPTGGQFGGSRKKQQTSADTYREAYPSLR